MPGVPGDNLAARALAEFRSRAGSELPPLAHHDREAHPGGGRARRRQRRRRRRRCGSPTSSPATRSTARSCVRLAAGLGSDVPSQLDPRHALVQGAGERVEPVELPPLAAVLVPDAEGLSTAAVYAELDRLGGARERARPGAAARASRHRAARRARCAALENDLQPAALSLRPELAERLDALRAAGALGAAVSGSGPTCFGLFADRAAAERAAAAAPGRARHRAALTYPPAVDVGPARSSPRWLAVLVAAYVVWRWRTAELRAQGARRSSLVLALAVYASGVLSALPDPKKVIEDIAKALGPWTYALVGVVAFLETGAFVGPGRARRDDRDRRRRDRRPGRDRADPADRRSSGSAPCSATPRASSSAAGSAARFLERHGPRVKITHERLEQVEGYFDRHGGKTILIGRFIGLVRALAPFIAGSSGLAVPALPPVQRRRHRRSGRRSSACSATSSGARSTRSRTSSARRIFGFAVTVGGDRRRGGRRTGAGDEIRAWLDAHRDATRWSGRCSSIGAAAVPLASSARRARRRARTLRFVWQPAHAGRARARAHDLARRRRGRALRLRRSTSCILAGDPGPTPLDSELLDLADRLRNDMLVDVAKVVTDLGALPTVHRASWWPRAIAARRARPLRRGARAGGRARARLHRPCTSRRRGRPAAARRLARRHDRRRRIPSGHAAYSTAWVAAAVVLTRRLRLVDERRARLRRAGDRRGGRRCRASTCARTGGRTWPAAGGSAPAIFAAARRRSRWSSTTSATMGRADAATSTAVAHDR